MSDGRYKPIGGMFQGVRGSTTSSDGTRDRGKLVKLNKDGKIEPSCFDKPDDYTALAQRVSDLEADIDSVKISINNLDSALTSERDARISSINAEKAARMAKDSELLSKINEIDDKIGPATGSAPKTTILDRLSAIEEAIRGINLTKINEAIVEIDNNIEGIAGSIRQINAKIGPATGEDPKTTIIDRISSLESDVDKMATDIGEIKEDLVEIHEIIDGDSTL